MDFELKYTNRLRRYVETNLEKFNFRVHNDNRLQRAAVAVAVVRIGDSSGRDDFAFRENNKDDAAVILTRRSARLKHHAGQWALPGGRLDSGETPEETALRELEEEVHLALTKDRILGRLDDFPTRSGFVITPVVIWGGMETELSANPEEVRSVHRVPLAELLRPDAPVLEDNPHSDNPILYMPVGHNCIATPTAALLYQFREVALLGKPTRVAHYEQPRFAWR